MNEKDICGIWYAGVLCDRYDRDEDARKAHQKAIRAAEEAGYHDLADQIRSSLKEMMTQ